MDSFRPCAVVPTYDNPLTLAGVVGQLVALGLPVIVVDDGSGPEGQEAAEKLGRTGLANIVRLGRNGGKGAAVKQGLRAAAERGYTHAVQVDADGQHEVGDAERFVEAARQRPEALVLGCPVFDASVPRARLWARQITVFFCTLETRGRVITDPMCGFRVYPLGAVARVSVRGDRMDFDPEIAVRMVWAGTPVLNLPIAVRYLTVAEGGVSHFQLVRDNLRISWMHTRLCCGALWRLLTGATLRARG